MAPDATSVAEAPVQIVEFGETVTTGNGFTVTVTVVEEEQLAAVVPVTV